MDSIVEPRDRYILRKRLMLIERDIRALDKKNIHILDRSMLKSCKVRVLPLSFDARDSLAPKFFTSFAPENMPEPTPEYVEKEYDTNSLKMSNEYGRLIYIYLDSYIRRLKIDFPQVQQTWSSNQIADYKFDNLYRMFEPEHGTLLLSHVANAAQPHIKCIMHNDLDVNDGNLLCGEILTVIRIMLGQLKRKMFVNDMIAPVLLFALNRRYPRAIEAYFDGQELLIRRTKSYDFTSLNTAGFKDFAQWFLGESIGDTSRERI
ncbi:uncharacterized protein ACLA_055350 [Aspergillus clavatus NRRL 1]|uniref:Uncharacterized protein n=1 Tax=Aspergillus clavatus (strain ATCC 1007 / CBS 513.65 / DSM 816 / NCTC 3887 / NRRL 1 / QM 1276 / 107) TaxID=344612 RepID=A1C9G3_ASPCL|nr:uncharacterized protein ACLA_055350 [Aspergillus clavatus NRRL 1]EAW13487.1 conserved hypothetical protein [Aspergillus clavatus NRRL 1]